MSHQKNQKEKSENTASLTGKKKEGTPKEGAPHRSYDEKLFDERPDKSTEGVTLNERFQVVTVTPNEFIPGENPEIPLNSTFTVYGKRRSGKSVFLRWYVHHALREWIPWYWCFTHTKHNMFFEGFMPAKFVIPEFSADILELIMERQKQAIDHFLKQEPNDPNCLNPRACIFWDDYNGKDITFNDALKDYYYTGRF